MNCRRRSTSSPISTLNIRSASAASSQRDAQEHAAGWVERGFPELLAVHFAQAFESLDLDAGLSEGENRREDLRDAGDVVDFVVVDQGVFGRQLFAADGFFLGQEIIVDGQAELLELSEELFQFLHFVQLLILLELRRGRWSSAAAVAVAGAAAVVGFVVHNQRFIAETFVAIARRCRRTALRHRR